MMELASSGYSAFGFSFDPFQHTDSTKDTHLPEYLIVPSTAQSILTDQPIAVFAQPGGGKSALRIHAFNFYKDSRGLRFPLVYIPETFEAEKEFHFKNLLRAAAKSVLVYLVSYPNLFFVLSNSDKSAIKKILTNLPFRQDALFYYLQQMNWVSEVENLLGVSAMSRGIQLENLHHEMISEVKNLPTPATPATLNETFDAITNLFGSKSIHILIDGLDGFTETRTTQGFLEWIAPLLHILEEWRTKNIYLKFFLPMNVSEVADLAGIHALHPIPLEWDDNLLAQVIRRRVFVASGRRFDSLDAISTPDVRGAELMLARQLKEEEKLPRQMILKCANLMRMVMASNQQEIQLQNLLLSTEGLYVR